MLRFNGRVVLVTGAGGGECVKAGGRVSSSLSCWEPPAPTFFVCFFPLVGVTHAAIAAVPASGLRAAVTRRLGERLIGLGGRGGGSGTDNDYSQVAESPEGGEVGLASLEWGPRNSWCSSPHLYRPPAPQGFGSGEDRGQAGLRD